MKNYRRWLKFILTVVCLGILLLPFRKSSGTVLSAPGEDKVTYIIVLRQQPQVQVAQEVRSRYETRIHQAMQILKATTLEPERPLLAERDEEAAYQKATRAESARSAAEEATREQAAQELDALIRDMRLDIVAESAAERKRTQTVVIERVQALEGEILHQYTTLNALAVAIPPTAYETLANHPYVASIYKDQLLHSDMNISTQAIGAPTWWDNGYDGGIWDVAVFDTGIDNDHPALAAHTFVERRCLTVADQYSDGLPGYDPTADDVNGHGTHVAGTIASTNSTYRGVAYGLDLLLNGKAGFDTDGYPGGGGSMYWSDGMDCVDWALINSYDDADVMNLSFGAVASADDGGYERFWDAVVDQMYAVVAISAGNNGPNSDTIGSPSIAYNVISVANIYDYGTADRGDDYLSTSSSRGPTPGGRKKPDLAAPGSAIMSANSAWETGSDFVSKSGTSMAAPHVAGAATLLFDRGITDPMAIKALLINTAEDRGESGWDPGYGWGYIDLDHLDFHPTDYFIGTVRARPDYDFYAGPTYANDTATLVWHRRARYNNDLYPGVSYALTDLDLVGYNEATNGWLDSSVSSIDNVEQIEFDNQHSSVVLKVDAWDTDISGQTSEKYALATEEGFSHKTGPSLGCTAYVVGNPTGPVGSEFEVNARIYNAGDLRAHNLSLQVEYQNLSKIGGDPTEVDIGVLDDGYSTGYYSWQFRKTGGVPIVHIIGTSYSYGEIFSCYWQLEESVHLPLVLQD